MFPTTIPKGPCLHFLAPPPGPEPGVARYRTRVVVPPAPATHFTRNANLPYSFMMYEMIWNVCHCNCPCKMMRIKYTPYHIFPNTVRCSNSCFSMGWWLIPPSQIVSAAPPFSQICLLSVSLVKFRFKTALSRRYRLVSEAVSQIAPFLVDFVLGCSWLPLPFCLPRSFANCKTSVFLDCIWGNKAKKGNRGGVQECNL